MPESTLRRLKQYSGRLATEAVAVMTERLPFFGELEASQRASVQLVVQTAVVNFAEWVRDPLQQRRLHRRGVRAGSPGAHPAHRARPDRRHGPGEHGVLRGGRAHCWPATTSNASPLTVGILRYSRDLAFAAASSYADAAEARGAWDSRMEASVVDAVVRGDTGPELLSRAAALNWDTTAPATVVVGTPPPGREELASEDVREIAARHGRAALADVHGTWLIGDHLRPARRRPTGFSTTCSTRSPTARW